ncbi:MAG: oligosaccharide flippase family protein [Pseudomonadota bacterium]
MHRLYNFSSIEAAARGCNWLSLVLLGIVLPVVEFGFYSLALAVMFIASSIAIGGQDRVLLRYVLNPLAKHSDEERVESQIIAGAAFLLNFLIVVIVCAATAFYLSPEFVAPVLVEHRYALLIWLAFNAQLGLLVALARATEDTTFYAIVRLGYTLTKLIGLVIIGYISQSVEAVIWVDTLVITLFSLFGLFYARHHIKPVVSRQPLTKALGFGAPFILNMLAGAALGHVDKLMLAQFVTTEEVSKYSFLIGITSGVFFIFAIVNVKYETMVYRERDKAKGERHLRDLLLLCVGGAFLALLFVNLALPYLLPLVGKPEFAAPALLLVLSFAYLIYPLTLQANIRFAWQEKTQWVPAIMIAASLLNIVLNYVLISRMGLMGAATATLVSYSFLAIVSNSISRRVAR